MSRSADDTTLLAGRNPVRESLQDGGRVEKIWLQNGVDRRFAGLIRGLAKEGGVPIQMVPGRRLDHMVPGVNHQGVVARLAEIAYHDVDEMLSAIAPTRDDVSASNPLVVLLDGIQDPHNFGAILRSAAAAGAQGVIVPARGSAPLGTAALKTSAGAARLLPVARVANIAQALRQMKERGYWVAGADGSGEQTVWDMDWHRPLAIVIGSEGEGMRPAVSAECDFRVRIPLRGNVESLNASVAAGILLFAAVRDRPAPS